MHLLAYPLLLLLLFINLPILSQHLHPCLLSMIFLYIWLQCRHVILIALMLDLPILTLDVTPGMISLLHLLQNSCLTSYGNLILYLMLILLMSIACFSARVWSYFAVSRTFLKSISTLCLARSFFNHLLLFLLAADVVMVML